LEGGGRAAVVGTEEISPSMAVKPRLEGETNLLQDRRGNHCCSSEGKVRRRNRAPAGVEEISLMWQVRKG